MLPAAATGKHTRRRHGEETRQKSVFHHVLGAGISGKALQSNEGPVNPTHDNRKERQSCHSSRIE